MPLISVRPAISFKGRFLRIKLMAWYEPSDWFLDTESLYSVVISCELFIFSVFMIHISPHIPRCFSPISEHYIFYILTVIFWKSDFHRNEQALRWFIVSTFRANCSWNLVLAISYVLARALTEELNINSGLFECARMSSCICVLVFIITLHVGSLFSECTFWASRQRLAEQIKANLLCFTDLCWKA